MIPSTHALIRFLLLAIFIPTGIARAEFGLVSDKKQHILDSGAGLVIMIDKANGGIRSIKWQGTELNGPKQSGIASGLGSTGTTVTPRASGDALIVTVQTDSRNKVVADFTHTYVMRRGDSTLYMTTLAMKEPGVGELRWITRLKSDLFTQVPEHSNLRGNTGAIESKDVFGFADGRTASKYYGNDQARDLGIRGITGPGRGVFMVYGNRESSPGGPFYRDIQNQTVEVYNYMNSGHNQTEPRRLGQLFGPYALCFTDGSVPKCPDMRFIEKLGIVGIVPESERGSVVLAGIKGRGDTHEYTVGFANEVAQYWTAAAKADGSATCSGMKPGTYTMTIYKGELSVHHAQITVKAGKPTMLDAITITEDPSSLKPIWRIGDWDGTPLEFRNGRNISIMHPSDSRQTPWKCDDFVIGQSKLADFPSCQWMDVNGRQSVKFTLKPDQLGSRTVRIGITASFSGARPHISVNDWSSKLPAPTHKIDSRSLTIGSYRGDNATFSFKVPAKVLVAGENTLTILVGSGNKGDKFLSPGYAIDCVDLY